MRYGHWKVAFMEQRCHGTMQIWAEPFTQLRVPKFFNLRTDPLSARISVEHDWLVNHIPFLYGAQALAGDPADRERRPATRNVLSVLLPTTYL